MNNAARKGFTLVELMITVGLFMIIIAIAVGAFTNAIRTQRQVSSLIAAQSNVSLAVEQIAREVRTGYLFCHAVTDNINPLGACGCQVSAGNTWTCSSLIFYDAQGNHIEYTLPNTGTASGTLASIDLDTNSPPQSITGNTVTVRYLTFRIFGQEEGDNWPPRVTIDMGITPSSTDVGIGNNVFSLQTTVSGRQIDCGTDASGNVAC